MDQTHFVIADLWDNTHIAVLFAESGKELASKIIQACQDHYDSEGVKLTGDKWSVDDITFMPMDINIEYEDEGETVSQNLSIQKTSVY